MAKKNKTPKVELSDIEAQVQQIWKKVLNKQDISLDENFFDAGGDSLLLPHLLFALQRDLKVQIEFIHLINFPNIKKFSAFLYNEKMPK